MSKPRNASTRRTPRPKSTIDVLIDAANRQNLEIDRFGRLIADLKRRDRLPNAMPLVEIDDAQTSLSAARARLQEAVSHLRRLRAK